MKCDNLYQEFKKFEGQPVKILTSDGKSHCGIDLMAYDDSVRIINKCNKTILIPYDHIDAVIEPQMELERCCRDHCDCRRDNDYDDNDRDYERDNDRDYDRDDKRRCRD